MTEVYPFSVARKAYEDANPPLEDKIIKDFNKKIEQASKEGMGYILIPYDFFYKIDEKTEQLIKQRFINEGYKIKDIEKYSLVCQRCCQYIMISWGDERNVEI